MVIRFNKLGKGSNITSRFFAVLVVLTNFQILIKLKLLLRAVQRWWWWWCFIIKHPIAPPFPQNTLTNPNHRCPPFYLPFFFVYVF